MAETENAEPTVSQETKILDEEELFRRIDLYAGTRVWEEECYRNEMPSKVTRERIKERLANGRKYIMDYISGE